MIHSLASLGIGTYYVRYYIYYLGALAALQVVAFLLRKRLAHGIRFGLGGITFVLLMRLVLFDNPIILKYYQRHVTLEAIGGRQWGVLDLEIDKYRRDLHQPSLLNMAVGSSQVGAIFSHWVSDPYQPLKVFSLAGMKTLDYVLYEDEIAAYNPQRVILYVSAFDLTASPELYSLPLAPSRPSTILSIPWRLQAAGVSLSDYATQIHAFIASQIFPEYRFSFIFQAFLKQWFTESPAGGRTASVIRQPPRGASMVPVTFLTGPGRNPVFQPARFNLAPVQAPPQTNPALTPEHINEFISYYFPEWIDYNYTFLRDFVEFCRARGIEVVIAEGQINPIVKSEKVDALNQIVRSRFAELEAQFSNVTFIPAADGYQFTSLDYRDLTHVERPAAMAYTRRLSSFLAPHVVNGVCGATFTSGWNDKETSGTDWLRWSNGDGIVRITAREPSDLILEGEVLSLARPNVVDVLVDDQIVSTWRITDLAWTSHPFAPVEFHAAPGTDLVVRFVSHAAPVRQPSDPRQRTIALKNVTLRRKADARACDVNADAPPLPGTRPWR